MKLPLRVRVMAELLGTGFLVTAVIGSGIMGERLAGGNVAVALLANTIATGAALASLIFILEPISGAHLNPAVSISNALTHLLPWLEALAYVTAQLLGGVLGTILAHLMFGLHWYSLSSHARHGWPLVLSEFVATFGLMSVILSCAKLHSANLAPFAIGSYIVSAYWFTSSTSFANPAVTIARSLSDTFAGIRPIDAPLFVAAQIVGALSATMLFQQIHSRKYPESA